MLLVTGGFPSARDLCLACRHVTIRFFACNRVRFQYNLFQIHAVRAPIQHFFVNLLRIGQTKKNKIGLQNLLKRKVEQYEELLRHNKILYPHDYNDTTDLGDLAGVLLTLFKFFFLKFCNTYEDQCVKPVNLASVDNDSVDVPCKDIHFDNPDSICKKYGIIAPTIVEIKRPSNFHAVPEKKKSFDPPVCNTVYFKFCASDING